MDKDELFYKIAFACVRGMGVDLAQKILDVIPTEKEFFDLDVKKLKEITQSRSKITEKDYRNSCLEKASKELDFLKKNRIKITYFTDEDFPQRLLHTIDSPILLYSIGDCNWNSSHMISIVGTRRCTEYGRYFCDKLVKELSESLSDLVIISGLAYGTDIAAHRACLKYNVPTIGIQACGLNKIYPADHRNDAAKIVHQGGSIVSDYTSQDVIHKGNFVARNRIIAGMSDCTVVIESAEKGGSLITANIASSYDRDVFALPGRVSDEMSKGCNKLIENNQAMLITSADDIINALRWDSNKVIKPTKELSIFPDLNEEEQRIVNIIRDAGDIHINQLVERLGIPAYRVLGTLMTLDYKGVVLTQPGCRFSLK